MLSMLGLLDCNQVKSRSAERPAPSRACRCRSQTERIIEEARFAAVGLQPSRVLGTQRRTALNGQVAPNSTGMGSLGGLARGGCRRLTKQYVHQAHPAADRI